jgi:hypothetical protein
MVAARGIQARACPAQSAIDSEAAGQLQRLVAVECVRITDDAYPCRAGQRKHLLDSMSTSANRFISAKSRVRQARSLFATVETDARSAPAPRGLPLPSRELAANSLLDRDQKGKPSGLIREEFDISALGRATKGARLVSRCSPMGLPSRQTGYLAATRTATKLPVLQGLHVRRIPGRRRGHGAPTAS